MLKGDTSRCTVQGWRKEAIVDAFISLARCSGAIPGIQQHLQAAHKLAVASPAQGGGMEAAMRQLKEIGQWSSACGGDDPIDDDISANFGGGGWCGLG